MPKYHLSYSGPHHLPESDDEMAAMMQAWERWFGQLGGALIDPGSPFGPRQTITSGGDVTNDGSANGYGIIEADDLADAVVKAKGCPVLGLGDGNAVQVSECLDM